MTSTSNGVAGNINEVETTAEAGPGGDFLLREVARLVANCIAQQKSVGERGRVDPSMTDTTKSVGERVRVLLVLVVDPIMTDGVGECDPVIVSTNNQLNARASRSLLSCRQTGEVVPRPTDAGRTQQWMSAGRPAPPNP